MTIAATTDSDAPWRIVDLPKIRDDRGNLSFIENGTHLPFDIARVDWIYDIQAGTAVAGEAYRVCRQLIAAISGSFTVELADASGRREEVTLSTPDRALLVGPMAWRSFRGFATNSVVLVISSAPADPADTITDISILHEQSNA